MIVCKYLKHCFLLLFEINNNLIKLDFFIILMQKSYKLGVGVQSYTVEFTAVNRQSDWLKISLVYEKSDKRAVIYDSNSLKRASIFIQNVAIENMSQTIGLTGIVNKK